MTRITTLLSRFVKEEDGASLVEYGLLVALIAVVCIAVITTLGTTIQQKFQQVVDAL